MASPNLSASPASWIAAGCAALAASLLVTLLLRVVKRSKSLADSPATSPRALICSLVARVQMTTLLLMGLVAGSLTYATLEPIDAATVTLIWSWVWKAAVIAIAIQFVAWTGSVIQWLAAWWLRHKALDPEGRADPALAGAIGTFRWLILTVVYAAILLLALENLGVDVTALIAGLGVGGIAIALAVQNVLGDLFGSLTITLDKPFVVGDFIVVGSEMGTIEKIGIKTTRVRSLGGEQLIFGNNDLLSSRIRNYKRMQERRIVFTFGVAYQTSAEQLHSIASGVREIVAGMEQTRFDRCHFQKFGASSLDFEVVYFVLSAEYNVYMDVQQAINLELMRLVQRLGAEFAYPTQTIYMKREARDPGSPPVGAGSRTRHSSQLTT
jgi:small-conductance mechanosensitive channel